MGSGPKVTRQLSAGHLGGPTAANNNDDYEYYAEENNYRINVRHYCPTFHGRCHFMLKITLVEIVPARVKNVNNVNEDFPQKT